VLRDTNIWAAMSGLERPSATRRGSRSRPEPRCSRPWCPSQDPVERRPSRRTPRWLAAGQAAVPVLAHQHQEEALQRGQPAGAPDRRLVSLRVRGEEACGRARRQQHPGGRQVRRRVADEQIAEVDNARQCPVRDDASGRPAPRSRPLRRFPSSASVPSVWESASQAWWVGSGTLETECMMGSNRWTRRLGKRFPANRANANALRRENAE